MLGECATTATRQTKYQAFGMYASSAGITIFASNATAIGGKAMGFKSGDLHEFLEIPRTYWSDLAGGAVNKSGEELNQWLDRLETLFKD